VFSASAEQTLPRRKSAAFGPRADQEAQQGTSGSSRTGRENATMHGDVEGTIAGDAGHENPAPELLQRRRPRKPGARAPTATPATRKQTRTRREVDTTGRHAGARDQSHNPRERRRVRHPPGIKELASDTSPIAGGIRTRERAEFDTKTEAHKRDATRHGARRRASTPGRRGETMAAPEAGAGGDRRGEGARANGTERQSGRAGGREGGLTCVEAVGYGGGLPEESLAERARHARGEHIPTHAHHPPCGPHLLGSSSAAAAGHLLFLRTPWGCTGLARVEASASASGRRGEGRRLHGHSKAARRRRRKRRAVWRRSSGEARGRRESEKGPRSLSVLYRRIGEHK
jgi:hypothetical protein